MVQAREEKNEFFFPGFIGMFTLYPRVIDVRSLMRRCRYAYSCPAISEFRDLWVLDFTGMVGEVYVPA